MKLRHATLIFISGCLWLAIGVGLLQLGLRFLLESIPPSTLHRPLIQTFSSLFGSEANVVTLLIAVALFIGYMKGRFVLAKSAKRVVTRICSFPNPTSIFNLYSWPYYLLIAGMMSLGIFFNFFGVPSDIRGMIDVAVGSALIQGALIYFRFALAMRKGSVTA